MIEINHLTKTYKNSVTALSDVNLRFGGGMFGLLGPNGAGKTTLMRILTGVLHPTSGRVSVFGHDLSTPQGRQNAKALLGYLPQEVGLYPNLTARELLDYVARLKGVSSSEARKHQIDRVLEIVRLADVANRPLKTYSGGMKRRIGIAQALLGDVKLLIVDEPTTGLDPEERLRIRNTLAELARQSTVILSTHIIEDISQSCRDLAVIASGRILYQGDPRQLAQRSRGSVWTLELEDGQTPPPELIVVSSMALPQGMQYRVLGTPSAAIAASPTDPTLEDGYLWLMHQSKTATSVTQ
ncbi:MAG: ABC transporter ATP-binding protein [Armatimonadota bacterium]|jgi:ABC-type multidrug transport system ATPase subunit